MKKSKFLAAGFLFLFIAGVCSLQAGTKTWKAATTGDWFTVANWTEGGDYPRAGDDVVITNVGASVLLTNSTEYLSSLTLRAPGPSSNTLIFSNWNTTLSATNVTIQTNGVMTLPGAFTNNVMSNNVYIVCSNLTIAAGGTINVSGLGYAGGLTGSDPGSGPGYGFGGGWAGGAGHGGWANKYGNPFYAGLFYGSIVAPVEPGSGGGAAGEIGGAGGGAVRIAATTIMINGSITADGMNGVAAHGGAGSGGSIYIACRTVSGTGGVLRAVGGRGGGGSYTDYAGQGGGGRIAVICDPAAQRALPVLPALQFSVLPGAGAVPADIGTIYFSDSYLLENMITNINGQVWGVSSWSPGSLTVSNVWIRFPEESLHLTVTNDLVVLGSSARLELGGSMIVTNFPLNFPVSATSGPSVVVGGNLIVSNGGSLYIYAGMSNNSVAMNYGALVTVAKDLYVATNSTIYPFSHARNGGSVRFRVRNLTVAPGGWINANGGGYASGGTGYGSTLNGLGPGGGVSPNFAGGGGYGGKGGSSTYPGGTTYGSSNAPISPGSGGGADGGWDSTSRGGGLVWIEAIRQVNVQNKITANGNNAYYFSGGGSGGGIYITCKDFVGSTNGLLQANGGGDWGGYGGDGGGGRIAVWRQNDLSVGPIQASVAGGTNSIIHIGQPGTIVWGWLPHPGTIIGAY